jgi:F-type H+-transporting ATPase subunit gamma
MASLKKIKIDLEIIESIKNIASCYQEIANLEMKRIRENVLKTRKFLSGVAEIYNHAKSAYIAQFKSKNKKEKEQLLKKISFIKRNGRKIIVFLSANERFYGPLIIDIYKEVLKNLDENCDLAVVGKIGRYLVRYENIKNKVFFFYLDDDHPTQYQIEKILNLIRNYERIIVFHGKFETVAFQKPVKTDISGGIILEERPQEVRKYLFEPSPEAILEFFEKEIIDALFNQTVLEHQLAKFASRMMSMYRATENAKDLIKKLNQKAKNIKRQITNKKQLEAISSFKLWENI